MIKEACGIFGVAFHPDAAELTRLGLFALQHRGQESAGIFLKRSGSCELHKGMGLVGDVFGKLPKEWWKTPGQTMAIGHVRYSTSGRSNVINAQPFAVEFDKWHLALAHNGTLSNGAHWRKQLKRSGAIFQGDLDTEVILHLASQHHQEDETPWRALEYALKNVEGAFSVLALCEEGLMAARDPHGFRPLAMGRLKNGAIVISSETCAFDMMGAEYERDIKPGEMLIITEDGKVQSRRFAQSKRLSHCIFEHVYFARPDSMVFEECVFSIRKKFGARLALEHPVSADIVMPVPDSGTYAALGFAAASGIPFEMGIMRNHYIGRTFIKPSPEDRKAAVNLKLNPIRRAIEGKRVCLVEDSIVRGNTSKERVRTLRENGAKEVHMRISCPPHISPCFYGIDFPSSEELIAHNHSIEEIAGIIDADSLAYLSLEGMLSCATHSADNYCHACFSGNYPVEPRGI
jgi:amidophosphoribosyltransferase